MSKKINETTASAINATVSLQALFEQYPAASIRKLAAATEVSYGIVLKASKAPIAGEAYDPEATNWAAITACFTKRNIDLTEVDWDALNMGPNRKGATLQKDISAFPVGCKVYLRKNNVTPYEVVYKTATHVVLQLVGTEEPIAWANNTFLINGPVFEPRATQSAKEEVAE